MIGIGVGIDNACNFCTGSQKRNWPCALYVLAMAQTYTGQMGRVTGTRRDVPGQVWPNRRGRMSKAKLARPNGHGKGFDSGNSDPCAAKCNYTECSGAGDMDKPVCQECWKCHDTCFGGCKKCHKCHDGNATALLVLRATSFKDPNQDGSDPCADQCNYTLCTGPQDAACYIS